MIKEGINEKFTAHEIELRCVKQLPTSFAPAEDKGKFVVQWKTSSIGSIFLSPSPFFFFVFLAPFVFLFFFLCLVFVFFSLSSSALFPYHSVLSSLLFSFFLFYIYSSLNVLQIGTRSAMIESSKSLTCFKCLVSN